MLSVADCQTLPSFLEMTPNGTLIVSLTEQVPEILNVERQYIEIREILDSSAIETPFQFIDAMLKPGTVLAKQFVFGAYYRIQFLPVDMNSWNNPLGIIYTFTAIPTCAKNSGFIAQHLLHCYYTYGIKCPIGSDSAAPVTDKQLKFFFRLSQRTGRAFSVQGVQTICFQNGSSVQPCLGSSNEFPALCNSLVKAQIAQPINIEAYHADNDSTAIFVTWSLTCPALWNDVENIIDVESDFTNSVIERESKPGFTFQETLNFKEMGNSENTFGAKLNSKKILLDSDCFLPQSFLVSVGGQDNFTANNDVEGIQIKVENASMIEEIVPKISVVSLANLEERQEDVAKADEDVEMTTVITPVAQEGQPVTPVDARTLKSTDNAFPDPSPSYLPNRKSVHTMRTIGCAVVLLLSGLTFVIFVFTTEGHPDIIAQVCGEFALMAAYTCILITNTNGDFFHTLTLKQCYALSILLQYLFMCYFFFIMLESMYMGRLLARAFPRPIPFNVWTVLLSGWGLPALIIGLFASTYPTRRFTRNGTICWLDTKTVVSWSFIMPMIMFNCITCIYLYLVLTSNEPRDGLTSKEFKRARICASRTRYACMLIFAGSVVAWGCGMAAEQQKKDAIYIAFSISSIVLGCTIIVLRLASEKHITKKWLIKLGLMKNPNQNGSIKQVEPGQTTNVQKFRPSVTSLDLSIAGTISIVSTIYGSELSIPDDLR